ncbi:hypothetical protein [Paracoccus binzhouensis]|uniref:hypothetical protein n=1 Tax=Paracoccus binzhouensis TaxID=2796149 RepID=UPI0018EEEC3B|nr:hypothetical protein [Paracoccus binzhouensis]
MSEQPQTTTPSNLSASARNYAREEDARTIGSNVLGLIHFFGQHMDLATLDGVTLAYDYSDALRELDRGVETSSDLIASKDWGLGVAMTPTVFRDGVLKSHILFNAAILEGLLEEPESKACQEVVHIIAHECAHVEINAVKDRQFPNLILRYRPETWYEGLRLEVIEASWDEYAACRISAGFGAASLENYQGVFLNILAEAGSNVREAILKCRHDANYDELLIEAQRNIGNLVKYASYVLGTADGLDKDTEKELPEISAALQGHWFAPFFIRLRDAHRALWERYGQWDSLKEFETIADIWLEMLADRGVEVTPQDDGTMYVNIPFRADTSSYQAMMWGLRQATKGLRNWQLPTDTGSKDPSDF